MQLVNLPNSRLQNCRSCQESISRWLSFMALFLAKCHHLSRFKEFVLLWIVIAGQCVEEDIIKQHY